MGADLIEYSRAVTPQVRQAGNRLSGLTEIAYIGAWSYKNSKKHLDAENVVLIDGDIVMSEKLVKEVVCQLVDRPTVLLDSSIKTDGDYNVEVAGEHVLVMSKELDSYFLENM